MTQTLFTHPIQRLFALQIAFAALAIVLLLQVGSRFAGSDVYLGDSMYGAVSIYNPAKLPKIIKRKVIKPKITRPSRRSQASAASKSK